MRSQWKRLCLAALLSCACFGATLLWYKSTEKKMANSGEIPLAQVSKVGDEVLRRPATRLLWQQVNTGDNLYNGETIRTSSRGELRIQFEDGRYIDLESDSLIVLQKSKGEISLDLMEGSVFVNAQAQQGDAGASGLVLNSKDGKVDLTGASASLSKGSGGRLDLQVLEGKAKVQGKDGRESEIGIGRGSSLGAGGIQFDSSNLTMLSPLPQKPMYIDPDETNPVHFKWRGFPAQWKVSLHAGPTRREVREIASAANPGDAEIHTKIPLGKYWWRLVAKDPATNQVMAESPLQRVEILARYAPTVIFPVADADIPVERSPFDMTFKWQRTEETSKIQLEVGSDPSLKKTIVNRAFNKEEQMTVPNLKEGDYYWRMSAFYEGSDKPVVGKIQRFTLSQLAAIKKDPVQIVWALPEGKEQVFGAKPALELTWEAKNRKEDIAGYRVLVQDAENLSAEPERMSAKETKFSAPIPKAGRYIASIEAVDKDGNVIGKSEARSVAAKEMPLLPAPAILPAEGVLQSGFDGRTELNWQAVQGAKEYWLTVLDKSGKELARKKYETNTASLKNMMPGEYSVKLEAIDQMGRSSTEGPVRTLVVPDKSNLRAPTLKKIKVN